MGKENQLQNEPFSYRSTKSGLVQISYLGKLASTLSGRDAERFVSRVETLSGSEAQLLMAKATGHFKQGTERTSKNEGKRR